MRTRTGYKIVRLHDGKIISACVPLSEATNYTEYGWTYADDGPLFVFRSELHARQYSAMIGSTGVMVACVRYFPLITRHKYVLVPGAFTKEDSRSFWASTSSEPWKKTIPTVLETDRAAAISLLDKPTFLVKKRLKTIIDLYGDEDYYANPNNPWRI